MVCTRNKHYGKVCTRGKAPSLAIWKPPPWGHVSQGHPAPMSVWLSIGGLARSPVRYPYDAITGRSFIGVAKNERESCLRSLCQTQFFMRVIDLPMRVPLYDEVRFGSTVLPCSVLDFARCEWASCINPQHTYDSTKCSCVHECRS